MFDNLAALISNLNPNRPIEDDSPTTTKAKLWIGFGIAIWMISIATGLTLGFGIIHEVMGVPNDMIWLLSGVLILWFVLTHVGVKSNNK